MNRQAAAPEKCVEGLCRRPGFCAVDVWLPVLERVNSMWDVLILPALIAAWFALFRWVLPALGLPTCLSGSCAAVPHAETRGREAVGVYRVKQGG
jgi:hypothetical protein